MPRRNQMNIHAISIHAPNEGCDCRFSQKKICKFIIFNNSFRKVTRNLLQNDFKRGRQPIKTGANLLGN